MAKKTTRKTSKKSIKSDKKISEKSVETKITEMASGNLKPLVFAALFAALLAAIAWFKIPLPFTPVPITLQTLGVLLSGAVLGPYYGALSMILYLIVGALGFPVFAGGGSGIGALLGPTGGYLFSYPVAAFIIGKLLERRNLNLFLKYFSFSIIIILITIVSIDAILKAGIIPFISDVSESVRLLIIVLGILLIFTSLFLTIYAKRTKYFSVDVMLAMFAGTLIIYAMGVLQARIVVKPTLPWSALFVGWVLPFIIGDTIKLLIAAYIAKTVNIKRYLK